MPHSADNFLDSYRSTLARYVEAGHESQLEEAYALGRAACANGATILELVDVHRAAVCALFDARGTNPGASLDASFTFLAEALATFEMTQRGYWEAHESVRRERAIALMLQNDLMPSALPVIEGLDLAVRYLPGGTDTHAGGDWYDVFELDDGRVGLVVGDVTGHGVAAAATMGQMRIAVLAYALGGREPSGVVEDLDVLVHRLGAGNIATMIYVTADIAGHQLVASTAGHPPPVLVGPDGRSRIVDGAHGRIIGVSPPPADRDQVQVPFPPGSHLVLYSDGLLETVERAGLDGLALLAEATDGFTGTAEELCDHVLATVAPEGSRDDICILVATLRPG